MSKIGKLPITVPKEVTLLKKDSNISITGTKGTIVVKLPKGITIEIGDQKVVVGVISQNKMYHALHGTLRAIIANAILGVSSGWSKSLELVGTGFRAEILGRDLSLTLGFSHPVKITAPEGISFQVEKNIIKIEGVDKALVGQVAANIRKAKPPEPYKGKGIIYVGEQVRRKPGKAAKAQGAVI